MPLLEMTQPICPIDCVPQKIMDDIAEFHVHRSILGIGERKTLPSLQIFLHELPEKALILVLCDISNHDNIGKIFHNAAAFSVMELSLIKPHAIHFTENQSEFLLVQF
ncbi:hypothetical protein MCW_00143 [Cardidatus Bartonella washoeensis 085-0475]|uniref:tRNA/rRNA methyltransferase SpoU type domain-containing protein n=2 Tax=Candidatus Bartonella washoeensis TaxID=186739 RepID=J1JNC0_9HYPH|nr:hypothetical protein MCW_00143 [Bartonella washoeensis 085-0475]